MLYLYQDSSCADRGEMHRKREDYFTAGVRLAWQVDPDDRTVHVYTALEPADVVLTESDTLGGTGQAKIGGILLRFRMRTEYDCLNAEA